MNIWMIGKSSMKHHYLNFWSKCLKIYELDPSCFLTAPRLAWQAALKRTKVKLDFLSDIRMFSTVQKGIR